MISTYQKLSEDFIIKFKDYLFVFNLLDNCKLNNKLKIKIKLIYSIQ